MRRGNRVAYIDSTSLNVCQRIKSNKVFKGLAKIGKSTKRWFFGFKLHIIIDERGNLMNAKLTKGNADDRSVVSQMTADMTGFLLALTFQRKLLIFVRFSMEISRRNSSQTLNQGLRI